MRIVIYVLPLVLGFSKAWAELSCSAVFRMRETLTQSLVREDYNKPTDFNRVNEYIDEKTRQDIFDRVDSVFSKKFDTRFWFSNTHAGLKSIEDLNVIDPEAKAVFVFFHGSGTSQSSGKNFAMLMNSLAKLGFSSVSFDLPFHSDGPLQEKFLNADVFMKWLHQILQKIKASKKPIYLVGHSFGPDVIAEYLTRFPLDVEGALLISPAGFNKVLSDWYDQKTSKMRFGGEVPENEAGGRFASIISEQFTWNKIRGVDPTQKNPRLKLHMLSGNREEYVPAPTGGSRRTPIGDNTYDIGAAMKEFFASLDYVIEPGVGHYIFNATDANGHNVVMREILRLAGFDVQMVKQMTTETSKRWMARDYSEKALYLYSFDRNFQSWILSQMRETRFLSLIKNPENEMKLKSVLDRFTLQQQQMENRIVDVILTEKPEMREFIRGQRSLYESTKKDRRTNANALIRAFGIYLNTLSLEKRESILDLFLLP